MYSYYFKCFCRFLQISACVIVAGFPAFAADIARPDPEIATGKGGVKTAVGKEFMAVTANPHATQAAYDILKRGGNAVDAMVAAQLVLGLVEPQSSGLGGGAFVLYYDAKEKKLHSFDARETAPFLAGPYLFQKQGKPMAFKEAVLGGRAVGVPGTPMLLSALHEQYGTLTWMELFEDAIKLAEDGFAVSPRLSKMIAHSRDDLALFPATKDYFLDADGKAWAEGHVLKNPAYAETLKDFAFHNSSIFYRGALASQIVETVQNIKSNPGLLNHRDFREYKVKPRDILCAPYRIYIVCSMGEPSSGGLTLLQALGMLSGFDLSAMGPDDPRAWHAITEASRLAFADRGRYMADPDYVDTPGTLLLDPVYLKERAVLIDMGAAMDEVSAGTPPGWNDSVPPEGASLDRPGTSHISIVDAEGNALSMTTTIEGAFGSHVMVGGFLLNNELTDFSFVPTSTSCHPVGATEGRSHERDPDKDSRNAADLYGSPPFKSAEADRGDDFCAVANRVEGGKRPRSSMAPTIVFDQSGAPVLVIGSAGGSNIIGYVLQRIISVLDWGVSIGDALAMPNILSKGDAVLAEQAAKIDFISDNVEYKDMNSGLTAIHIQNGNIVSAADPRREGTGMGD